MKSFKEYLSESENWMNNPVPGDTLAINIREECLIESSILAVENRSVLITCDDKMLSLLENYGCSLDEGQMKEAMWKDAEKMSREDFCDKWGEESGEFWDNINEWPEDDEEDLDEAEYQGRKVPLGKPMRGDVKKFKVYVKDPSTGNIKKVNFGHGGTSAKRAGQKTMKIKKSNPARRKSFRARHNCDNPGPRTKARYWSCRAW